MCKLWSTDIKGGKVWIVYPWPCSAVLYIRLGCCLQESLLSLHIEERRKMSNERSNRWDLVEWSYSVIVQIMLKKLNNSSKDLAFRSSRSPYDICSIILPKKSKLFYLFNAILLPNWEPHNYLIYPILYMYSQDGSDAHIEFTPIWSDQAKELGSSAIPVLIVDIT